MFFDEEFIAYVEANPIEGVVDACEKAFHMLDQLSSGDDWNGQEHEFLWEVGAFVQLILDSSEINLPIKLPEATGNLNQNCSQVREFLDLVVKELKGKATLLKVEGFKNRYKSSLKSTFAFEFSQGDLDRIQTLVNELRDQISRNKKLSDDHKQRLLARLEKLQSELHKRVADLDRFWGLVGDAGVVLGKLGKDAKPIVDRIKELAEIVWKTQARTEELPSDAQNPMIEHDDT